MEDLGELGFWLAVGIVLAAMIVSGAQKERERERQKHDTLRELARLEGEGKLTPETLKYMRERDAAEQHIWREASGLNYSGGAYAAFAIGAFSFFGGVLAAMWASAESWHVPVSLMLGIWVGGLLIALVVYFLFRGRKKAPPPGA